MEGPALEGPAVEGPAVEGPVVEGPVVDELAAMAEGIVATAVNTRSISLVLICSWI